MQNIDEVVSCNELKSDQIRQLKEIFLKQVEIVDESDVPQFDPNISSYLPKDVEGTTYFKLPIKDFESKIHHASFEIWKKDTSQEIQGIYNSDDNKYGQKNVILFRTLI